MAVTVITNDNFENEVVNSDKPVVIDFWASWCGPCKMMSPVVDELSEKTDSVKVGKVNVDEQRELAMRFQVMSIPTIVMLKNGKEVNRVVGAMPLDSLVSKLGIQ